MAFNLLRDPVARQARKIRASLELGNPSTEPLKLAPVRAPIYCPFFHQSTCFNPDKPADPGRRYSHCDWNQGMGNIFPADCPLPDFIPS